MGHAAAWNALFDRNKGQKALEERRKRENEKKEEYLRKAEARREAFSGKTKPDSKDNKTMTTTSHAK